NSRLESNTTVGFGVNFSMPEMPHARIVNAPFAIRNYPFDRPYFPGIGTIIGAGKYGKVFRMASRKTINFRVDGFPSIRVILIDRMPVDHLDERIKSSAVASAFSFSPFMPYHIPLSIYFKGHPPVGRSPS